MWLKFFFKKLYDVVIELLYPKHCAMCGKHLLMFTDIALCSKCISAKVEPKCVRDDRFAFDEAVSVLRYDGEVKSALRRYKFSNIRYYAKAYAYLMDKATEDRMYLRNAVICPVPLSAERDRLYNQTEVIARQLSAGWGNSQVENLLYKTEEIKPLSSMKLSERKFYIAGAVGLNPQCCVSGKDVLLIDDIYTSGTTTNECAKVLKSYGAHKVYVLCACYD